MNTPNNYGHVGTPHYGHSTLLWARLTSMVTWARHTLMDTTRHYGPAYYGHVGTSHHYGHGTLLWASRAIKGTPRY